MLQKRLGVTRPAIEFKSLAFIKPAKADIEMQEGNVFADNAGDDSDDSEIDIDA